MPSGVKIKDIVVGAGEEAVRGKTVVANVRMFLNRGTEIIGSWPGSPRMRIDLGKRECFAGLRYGIEGMRVGGQRELWVDTAEKGNAITRDKRDNALCLTVGVTEGGQQLCCYSIVDSSRGLVDSRLFQVVNGVLKQQPATPERGSHDG